MSVVLIQEHPRKWVFFYLITLDKYEYSKYIQYIHIGTNQCFNLIGGLCYDNIFSFSVLSSVICLPVSDPRKDMARLTLIM